MERFSTHSDIQMRHSHKDTGSALLEQCIDIAFVLALDDPRKREEMAKRSTASETTLALLARDPDSLVRYAVAQNPNTPLHVLHDLAREDDYLMRWCLVARFDIPTEILEDLAKISTLSNRPIRRIIAGHQNTSSTTLTSLAQDGDFSIRLNVARNLHTPKEALEILAGDHSCDIRLYVASHPNTPEILRKFLFYWGRILLFMPSP